MPDAPPPIRQAGSAAVTCIRVRRSPGLRPGSRKSGSTIFENGFPATRSLPPGRLWSFGSRLFIGENEIDVAGAQRAGEFKKGYDSRITAAALQVTDVLLRKAGRFGKFLLREALLLPQSCEIPTDQLAHVHPRKLRLYIL